MRRWMAVVLLLSMVVLTACSGSGTKAPEPAPSQNTEPAKTEPVKLRFLSLAWQKQAIEANKAIVDAWNKANPNIQVEYVQGDWNSVNDYLLTSFESGDVPDVFHYEAPAIVDFAKRGYLTDLTPLIPEEAKKDVTKGAWDSVTLDDGKMYGFPFLMEPLIILYNPELFKAANVTPPSLDKPWTWDEFRNAAKALTKDTNGDGKTDQYGVAFGLKSPTNRILNLALNYDGSFFYKSGNKTIMRVGEAEKKVLRHIHDMMYDDKSASLDGLGQTGTTLLPGFYAGKYAMVPGIGAYARQSIVTEAPKEFKWGVLPPLKGTSQNQGINTQTLSIPKKSKHPEEAMKFINFALNTQNMATLAQGDWLVPTRVSSMSLPAFQTDENGWKISTESAKNLVLAPYLYVPGFSEWKSKVAVPVFSDYFANKISLEEAARRLEDEGTAILSRN